MPGSAATEAETEIGDCSRTLYFTVVNMRQDSLEQPRLWGLYSRLAHCEKPSTEANWMGFSRSKVPPSPPGGYLGQYLVGCRL